MPSSLNNDQINVELINGALKLEENTTATITKNEVKDKNDSNGTAKINITIQANHEYGNRFSKHILPLTITLDLNIEGLKTSN
ncbi:Uncharacterised protein [Mycoplasmopsis maculosa]|uniref:Lipoprotein-associated type-17 domain-containing protein n=1 Tax=Mycoplasmopsis maculosa TaxID=114885 RepID=A0A449B3J3_9BACT|nr:Uncharacterised protein [Mycoplasmopsis maculosa]